MRLGPVMVDVAGLELTPDDIERLQHPQVGGVILFARNFAAPLQLIQLTHSIRELRTPQLLIASTTKAGACSASATASPRFRRCASWASSGTAIRRRRSPRRAAAAS